MYASPKSPFTTEEDNRFMALEEGYLNAASVDTNTTDTGAIEETTLITKVSSAGAESRTLAAPTKSGKIKIITMSVHGGDTTLAGTHVSGNSAKTYTFGAVADTVILMSVGALWYQIGGNLTAA